MNDNPEAEKPSITCAILGWGLLLIPFVCLITAYVAPDYFAYKIDMQRATNASEIT